MTYFTLYLSRFFICFYLELAHYGFRFCCPKHIVSLVLCLYLHVLYHYCITISFQYLLPSFWLFNFLVLAPIIKWKIINIFDTQDQSIFSTTMIFSTLSPYVRILFTNVIKIAKYWFSIRHLNCFKLCMKRIKLQSLSSCVSLILLFY